jgi:hypothetical protein
MFDKISSFILFVFFIGTFSAILTYFAPKKQNDLCFNHDGKVICVSSEKLKDICK